MKVLFTTPILEFPARGGPQIRMLNSIKALNETAHELHIVSQVNHNVLGGERAEEYFRAFSTSFCYSPSARKLKQTKIENYIKYKLPNIFRRFDAAFIISYAKAHNIDVIWVGYGNISHTIIKYLNKHCGDIKLVCDTDSVWSRFLERELPFEPNTKLKQKLKKAVLKKRLEELKWVNWCDKTLAVSDFDAKYYNSHAKDASKVAVFANAVDVDTYQYPETENLEIRRPSLLLTGTFGKPTSAMNQAAKWVIESILPAVKKSIPDIHLYIVGNHSDHVFKSLNDPNITVTGKVESVLPYLKNVSVSLVPLKYESGTRLKILEAAASHCPIVSTTLGAEGLNFTHQRDILIADSTEQFSSAIVTLIQNSGLSEKLTKEAFKNVSENYGIPTLKRQAKNILSQLV